MSQRSIGARTARLLVLVLGMAGLAFAPARAAGPLDAPASAEPRVPVATCTLAVGFYASEGKGRPWKRVYAKDAVYSRDLLTCLPALRAKLEPGPNTVELTLWGNLPQLSGAPVLESAVILHDTKAFDLDFTLVRGRVVLTNKKAKGPAKVWLRAVTGVQVTLAEPGDSIALEIAGRWPAGVPFKRTARAGHAPILVWEVHVLKGHAELKAGKSEYALEFPGPAYFYGDSVSGPDEEGPQRRTKLPRWADKKAPPLPEQKMIAALVDAYREKVKNKETEEVASELLAGAAKDKDAVRAALTRQIVITASAALDDVDRVIDALDNTKYADLRRSAVVGLRHWIGSAPGRDEVLYERLVDGFGYTKTQAETVMQLLHSPFQADQPETYEALIAYLRHSKLAVRELALWHLQRLAPSCRDIPYDAAASAPEREKAYQEWKKRIPAGELPPPPKLPLPKKKTEG